MDAAKAERVLLEHGFTLPGWPKPESRFFEPDDRCPDPGRWHSTDGDSTELEVSLLIAGLVRGAQPDLVVETGAAFGQTTEMIGRALRENGHGRLVSYEPDIYRAAIAEERCQGLPVYVFRRDSRESPATLPVNFLFLDSVINQRVEEFMFFRPRLTCGATVVFHDSPHGSSLRHEIQQYVVEPGYVTAIDFPTPRGLTVCEVL